MKKSKLSVSLVATFVAAMGMSSCSSLSSSKDTILSFKGYDGVAYNIITDDMYAEYQTTDNITKFYNPILEVMIRNQFAKTDSPLAQKKSYATIKKQAQEDVKDKKKEAENSSESYKTAWENILNSYGVENEKGLLEHFIYEYEKEEAENWYYDTYKEYLTKEYIGITEEGKAYNVDTTKYPYEGKINSRLPYHIRHILVNTSGSGTEYGVDTISKDNAKKLANVVEELLDGTKTFGQIAFSRSDDGSASSYGDVGIMNNEASTDGSLKMVAEFQLGIYAYDAMLGAKKAKATADVKKGLGISSDVAERIASTDLALKDNAGNDGIAGLTRVPASVFAQLKEYAETEEAKDGYNLANGKEQIYPRNILWNKYLNHHNPFIITNNGTVASSAEPSTWGAEDFNKNIQTGAVVTESVTGKCGYRSAKALGLISEDANDFGVLCDENDNVIIGVRSTYGIHFMLIQKSILDYGTGEGDNVSLEQYYTTYVPTDTDYPKDSNGKDKATYVNYITSTDSNAYKTRANTIKDAIKGYDSTYEYRLFEKLYEMSKDSFTLNESGQKLIDNIINYIKIQRESKIYDQESGMERAWDKYFELIELQNETRQNAQRTIPEGCIAGFKKAYTALTDAEKAQYEEGGVCYYGK